jgi:hypothetical protein
LCQIFNFSSLGDNSLPMERISALGAAAALIVALAWELSSKVSPGVNVVAQFCYHTAAPKAPAAPIQSYQELKKELMTAPCQSYICCDAKVKFAPHFLPLPRRGYEKSCGRS